MKIEKLFTIIIQTITMLISRGKKNVIESDDKPRMINQLRILPDYYCSGIYIFCNEGFFEPIEPEEIGGLSQSLIDRISNWAKRFDATLNMEDPNESGFLSKKESDDFEKEGLSIWQVLKEELPEYKIVYYSVLKHREFSDLCEY